MKLSPLLREIIKTMALPADVRPGNIYRHSRFYRNSAGIWQTRYLLVLASTPENNVIFRLLTQRAFDRQESPPCSHRDPHPGFYLGVLGGSLTTKSWLDLRGQDDYDGATFVADCARGILKSVVVSLSHGLLRQLLDCVADAEDTTAQQERALREERTRLQGADF